jgi:HK97 family phage prohead protease
MTHTFTLIDSNSVNSYGFSVLASGAKLDRFVENPQMLYCHDKERQIGRWENIRIAGDALLADAVFDEKDELAMKIAGKVERGFLKGASVGIKILKVDNNASIPAVVECELYEASICPIPSDPKAIKLELSENDLFQSFYTNYLNHKKMDKTFQLSAATMLALGLHSDNCDAAKVELAVAKKDSRIAELETKLKAAETEKQTAYLETAVREGKITAKDMPQYQELAALNFESVKKLIDGIAVKPTASLAATVFTGNAAKLSWDELDRNGGLAKLKAEKPDEYKALYAEKFGVEI